jgi:hypothetical protein
MARTQIRLNTQSLNYTLTPEKLRDFAVTDAGGLFVTIAAGRIYNYLPYNDNLTVDSVFIDEQGIGVPDDATRYLSIDGEGNVSIGTTGFPANNMPLAIVTTVSGAVTLIEDARSFFSHMVLSTVPLENQVPTGDINGINTDFNMGVGYPITNTVKVYLNGIRQTIDTDYTVGGTNNRYIYFVNAPQIGDSILVDFRVR